MRSPHIKRATNTTIACALAGLLLTSLARADEYVDRRTLWAFEYRAASREPVGTGDAVRPTTASTTGPSSSTDTERRRIARGTRVIGSLGQSLQAIGLGGTLTKVLEQALAPRIALTKDVRAGDTIKLIADADYIAGRFAGFGTVHAFEYTSQRIGKLQAFWFEREPGRGEFYDQRGRALSGSWLRTPIRYDRISSRYDLKRRHPLLKRIVPHYGVDYSADRGTPVFAAADGQVTFAGRLGPNGNLVSLRHESGYESHYAHLAKIGADIKPGRKLKQAQVLGYVGSTGRSTGPHLHFALKHDGRFVDPATQLDGPGAPLPHELEPRFQAQMNRLRVELGQIAVSKAPAPAAAATPVRAPALAKHAAVD